MCEILHIGMIGAGYAAHLRAQAVRTLNSKRVIIRGVYDKNIKNAVEFSKELSVCTYSTLEEICRNDEINTVTVAVPNKFHYEIVKYALERNKNAICEYPLVLDKYKKAEELVTLAEKKNLFLHVGQTMNFDADYTMVQSYRKELGTLYMGYKFMSFGGRLGSWFELDGFKGDYEELAEWYIKDTARGGWIVSAHYHGIQHFRKIFGDVVSVSAFDSTSQGISAATIMLRHEDGASSSIQWGMPIQGKWFNTMIVSGSKGSIEVDGEKYLIHTEKTNKKGKLKTVNTFVEDLKTLLDELDGKCDMKENNMDMLMNLKIALFAEQSAAMEKVIRIR